MTNDVKMRKSRESTNLEEIKKFENLIQAKLPEDYRSFLLKYNGGHPIRDTFSLIEPINEKNKEAGIDCFFALYGGEVCNISNEFKYSRKKIPDELLPIGCDSGGKICLGVRGDYLGKLYYWTTNWSSWSEDDLNYLYLIANSWADFITGLYEYDIDGTGNVIRRFQDGTVTITPAT